MDFPFFKILLVVVLVLMFKPILGLLVRLLLRVVFRRALEHVGQRAMSQQPDRIHLTRETEQDWDDPEAVERLLAPLAAHGFQEAGDFSVDEMEGVLVRFRVQPNQRVVACVCEHPQAGVWLDLVSSYRDGTAVTFTTSQPTGLESRPGCRKVNAPEMAPEALYERLLRERPAGDLEEWTAANVATKFEDAYARETAWRKNKGVSAEEVACQIPQMATAGAGASSSE
jgi:hypothetical protein